MMTIKKSGMHLPAGSGEKKVEETWVQKHRPAVLGITAITLLALVVFIAGIRLGGQITISEEAQHNAQQIAAAEVTPAKGEHHVRSTIVAIDNDGRGVTASLSTDLKPGSGLVLVNINKVLADINTLYSARTAVAVAKNVTGVNLNAYDVVFNVEANANVVGGQSAGSTMAMAVIAAIMNRTMDPAIMMTGSIEPDGRIGEAGAIKEKAQAARDAGAKMFLVPPGLGTVAAEYTREKRCSQFGEKEFCQIRYVEKKISLSEELSLQIEEVATIEDAMQYFWEDIS